MRSVEGEEEKKKSCGGEEDRRITSSLLTSAAVAASPSSLLLCLLACHFHIRLDLDISVTTWFCIVLVIRIKSAACASNPRAPVLQLLFLIDILINTNQEIELINEASQADKAYYIAIAIILEQSIPLPSLSHHVRDSTEPIYHRQKELRQEAQRKLQKPTTKRQKASSNPFPLSTAGKLHLPAAARVFPRDVQSSHPGIASVVIIHTTRRRTE